MKMKHFITLLMVLLMSNLKAQNQLFVSTFSSFEQCFNYSQSRERTFTRSFQIKPIDISLTLKKSWLFNFTVFGTRYIDLRFNDHNLDFRMGTSLNLNKIMVSDSFSIYYIGIGLGINQNIISKKENHYSEQFWDTDQNIFVNRRIFRYVDPNKRQNYYFDIKTGFFIFNKKTDPFILKIESILRIIPKIKAGYKEVRINLNDLSEEIVIDEQREFPLQKVIGFEICFGYKFNIKKK